MKQSDPKNSSDRDRQDDDVSATWGANVGAVHPFEGRDVSWLVDTQASARPDKAFLNWEPFLGEAQTWTYRAFAEETRRYAAGLSASGITPGDFVLLHMDNSPEFLFAWFACARIGAVVVTTNTRSSQEELAYFVEHSQARAAITQPRYAELVEAAAAHRLSWIACTANDWGKAEMIERPHDLKTFESLRGEACDAPTIPPDPTRPNSVQYTSGTTARPKGVVWTQANALWVGKVTATHLRLRPDDVTPVFMPLFHTNALGYSTLATMWSGGAIVLTPRFSATRFWDLVVKYSCTWSSTTLFPIRALENLPAPRSHGLRIFGLGSADLPETAEKWGVRTIGWFGMTETVAQCTMSDLDRPAPQGSMGTPSPEYEVALRNEDGTPAEPGETGQLWIRGKRGISIFLEYLNNPDATAKAFDEYGWFDTGDLAVSRGESELFYAGRAKDMLKVSGENVAAIEIETVILRVPSVREVAVVGQPDHMRGEVPVAFVVTGAASSALEAQIMETCRDALADFKRPTKVVFVDSLPKGTLDKVLKRELRNRLH